MKEDKQLALQFKEYARPMIIRSLFGKIMHTADQLIAALYIGASALVATTLISPLMFLIAALAMFFISGLGAYVGLLIGKGNVQKANKLSSGILIIMGVLGTILMIPCVFFSDQIAYMLGARGQFLIMSAQYLKFFALSFPFLLVGRGLDVLILNDGSPGYSFKLNILTTVSNLALNVFAVVILGLGIKGLALATFVSTFIGFVGGAIYFLGKNSTIKLVRPSFKIKTILRVAYNGFSDFAMMIVESIMVYVINMAFVWYLTPEHFEAYAAANLIVTMFYSIYMGASMGLQPILSQMMGRGEFHFLKDLIFYSVKKSLLYGVMVYLALIPVIGRVLKLFVDKPLTVELGVFFYLTIGVATLFSNMPLQMTVFFTAINRPMESALISCVRTLVLIPPIVFILIKTLGAVGLASGMIVADLIMILGLMVFIRKLDISDLKVYE